MPVYFKPFAALAAITVAAALPQLAHAQSLTVGSKAPALKVAKWVKGKPITFKPGTISVVEFWATWCGPCKVSIPHLTELAHQYKGKVNFVGVSVFEHDPKYAAKVAKFVTGMGGKMDYAVATDTDPDNGFMAKNWMEAAAQDGIPTAFIVGKDGKIEWIGHPMEMEKPLAAVVAGKWDRGAVAKQLAAENATKAKLMGFQQKIVPLIKDGKAEEAAQLVDSVTKGEGEEFVMQIAQMCNSVAWNLCDEKNEQPKHDFPMALALATKGVELTKEQNAMILDTLAFAQYRSGDLKAALATQEKAIATLDKTPGVTPEDKKDIQSRLTLYKSKQ